MSEQRYTTFCRVDQSHGLHVRFTLDPAEATRVVEGWDAHLTATERSRWPIQSFQFLVGVLLTKRAADILESKIIDPLHDRLHARNVELAKQFLIDEQRFECLVRGEPVYDTFTTTAQQVVERGLEHYYGYNSVPDFEAPRGNAPITCMVSHVSVTGPITIEAIS